MIRLYSETGERIVTTTDHLPIGSLFVCRVPFRTRWALYRVGPYGDRCVGTFPSKRHAYAAMARLVRHRA